MSVRYRQKKRHFMVRQHGGSPWLLYLFSLPYLFAALSHLLAGNALRFGLVLGIFLAIVLAAVFIGRGIRRRRELAARRFVFRAPFPMIFSGSIILAVAVFVAAWLAAGMGWLSALAFAGGAALGVWFWYGLDPVGRKGLVDIDSEARKILADSEKRVAAIEKAREKISQPELDRRLQRIVGKAGQVLSVLAEQPEKIRQSRRFLHVYLDSTENIVKKFARTHDKVSNAQLEANFREVLDSIEDTFSRQYETLLSSDVFDLDVDIEVLQTLMKNQGMS